jgi:TonB-linked SusC/RagA family outer membrane protein
MILRNSTTQNHEISVSGADEKTSYALSLGYMDENGLLLNDNLKRYNTRINLDHKITKTLSAGVNLQYTMRDWDRRDDDIFGQLIKMHSMAEPYLSDGTILDRPSELALSHTNPLLNEVPGYYVNNTRDNRLFGNVHLEWEIINGLRFKSVFGIDQQSSRQGEYKDYMCTENYQFGRGSEFASTTGETFNYTFENTLNYSLNLGEIHEIQLLAGQSAQQNVYESLKASGFGSGDHYLRSSFYDLSFISSAGRNLENSYIRSNMLSYFGRANYKLMNKYLITATLRTDGSSVLAEGNKWKSFPSVAAAWVISEEPFLRSVTMINNLKFRLSWGKAGNSAVDAYRTLTTLGIDKIPYTFSSSSGFQLIRGQVPSNLGNKDLTWEITSTFDAGLDITLLRERISATVDFYSSKTDGLLLFKALPPTSVFPQVIENVGKTENIGLEATLNLRVIDNKDFSWNSDFSFSTNRDKIVSLASGETRDVSNKDLALVVGEPVRAFYDYEANGCWTIDEADQAAIYNKVPGDIKLVDANSDDVINDLDKRLYNKSPRFILGWNNTITYKGITLSALAYSRIGQWIEYQFNTQYKPTEADGSPDVDFWTPENQNARFPRPGITSQSDMPALAFEKASFLKIRDVMLSYTVPNKLSSKVGISNLRVYSSLQNYFTFSNLDNYDPERGGEISNPLAKQAVIGINLEF